jgi:hypothetical protein
MGNKFFEIITRLTPSLRAGDLNSCERAIAAEMQMLPPSPFTLVLDVAISNEPADAARHFDAFFESEAKRTIVAAAYTEMNGFYINPDLWYCELFAYTAYGGHGDYNGLSDWQSGDFPSYPLRGMETLQKVYASDAWRNESYRDPRI